MGNLSEVRWVRVLLASLAVIALNFVVVFLIVTGYATYLGFQARGAPDIDAINAFAASVSPWLSLVATVLLTFLAARWVARRATSGKQINGLLVGVLVAVIGLVLNGFSLALIPLVETVLVVAAGWAGGRAA